MASKNSREAAKQAAQAGTMNQRQIWVVLIGLMSGMFLAALDQSVVSSAMRTIADDLDGLALQAWATTAYLITSTVSTPIYGKLGDIFGRRPLFMVAIGIFILGSLATGLAGSMFELAMFRAIQGLGAGGLFSLALTIVADIVPPRERARYQGMFLAVFGTSSVAGPVIGGAFAGVDEILFLDGWRWVFLMNLPIGAVSMFMVLTFLHIPHNPRPQKIDWWGAVTIVMAVVPILLVAEQGREWGWSSPLAIAMYVTGVAGIIAFIFIERRMGGPQFRIVGQHVRKAGGMRQQLAYGDGPHGVDDVVSPALLGDGDFRFGELGQVVGQGIIDEELARFLQHHDADANGGLSL